MECSSQFTGEEDETEALSYTWVFKKQRITLRCWQPDLHTIILTFSPSIFRFLGIPNAKIVLRLLIIILASRVQRHTEKRGLSQLKEDQCLNIST
jgi:hypothetical protein